MSTNVNNQNNSADKPKKSGCVLAMLLCIVLFSFMAIFGVIAWVFQTDTDVSQAGVQTIKPVTQPKVWEFELFSSEPISSGRLKHRIIMDVDIDDLPIPEAAMESIAEKVVRSHPRVWESTVFIQLPDTPVPGQAYASVDFAGKNHQKTNVFGVEGLLCTKWHPRIKPDGEICKRSKRMRKNGEYG